MPEPASLPTPPRASGDGAAALEADAQAAAPRPHKDSSRTRKGSAPPVLVEVRRGRTIESRHRGHIVHVDRQGSVSRAVGAPGTEVMMRSTVKPFGAVALIESGAADDLELTPAELAILCASHTGEDKHVRTLQAIFRRASVSQALLRCGTVGAPADVNTATRLARDGEAPGAIRHGCSGFHAASILMSAHAGWSLDDYAEPRHPSQAAVRETVARLLGRDSETLHTATDNCGLLTYEVTLRELARLYLMLADPDGPTVSGERESSATALRRVRDAMMGAPDLVGGTYQNLDTDLMRKRPRRLVVKSGADGLQAMGLVATDDAEAGAIVIKIEDGDLSRRATTAAAVESLAQIGELDDRDLRTLAEYHHPTVFGPAGDEAASALAHFGLAARKQDG